MARILDEVKRQRIVRLLMAGRGVRDTARTVGCSPDTVMAIRNTAKEVKPARKRRP